MPLQRINLEKIVSLHVEDIEKDGDEWNGLCPFCHGGTKRERKFYIDMEYGLSICHRSAKCGWKGNAVTFISELFEVAYREALQILNEGTGASIKEILAILKDAEEDPYKPLPDTVWIEGAKRLDYFNKSVFQWLEKRGYEYESFINRFPLYIPPEGLYPGRAIFEVKTEKLRAYQLYDYTGLKEKKTINPEHQFLSRTLYDYDNWKDKEETILIHEGIFDAARSITRGYNATCVFGTNLSMTQKYLLTKSKMKNVYVVLDGDTKTQDIKKDKAWQMACELAESGVKTSIVRLPKLEDPDSISENEFRDCIERAYPVLSKAELRYAGM